MLYEVITRLLASVEVLGEGEDGEAVVLGRGPAAVAALGEEAAHELVDERVLGARAHHREEGQGRRADVGVVITSYSIHYTKLYEDFLDWEAGRALGIHLDEAERVRLITDLGTWSLSQFLHGEQGALLAACQVTEAVQFMDGKFYGATQVVDEARHVEVFARYLETKAEKLYQVNDNLFTIIDALMTDARWDMKFLGMQIMIEGLALGAFGTMYHRNNFV